MQLNSIQLENFRNILFFEAELNSNLNFIIGDNGSGKTSFLEALYILGRARSFRTTDLNLLIAHEQSGFRVLSRLGEQLDPLGIERTKNRVTQIRYAGESITSRFQLAQTFPVQCMNFSHYQLIQGAPTERRHLFDWGLFHVKQSFPPLWQKLMKILKQRNAALRQGYSNASICAWNESLVEVTNQIQELRGSYFEEIKETFRVLWEQVSDEPVELTYYQGWPNNKVYEEVLLGGIQRDRLLGYTQYGAHRADLRVQYDTKQSKNILSLGQQKLVAVCLYGALVKSVSASLTNPFCFLIDDLPAELDRNALDKSLQILTSLKAKLFITFLEEPSCLCNYPEQFKMFHVKHGRIEQVE